MPCPEMSLLVDHFGMSLDSFYQTVSFPRWSAALSDSSSNPRADAVKNVASVARVNERRSFLRLV